MTSANSLSKGGFSAALKTTVKQRGAGAAVLFVFNMLISFAIAVLAVLDYRTEIKSISVDLTYEASIVAGIAALTDMVYSFFASFRYFKEIYKKRNCDFYFSAPIKREEYFNANFLFGTLVTTLSIVIPAVLFCIYVKFQVISKVSFFIDVKIFAAAVLVILLAALALLSAFIMCAVISGKRLHYIVLCLICASFAPAAFAGVANKMNTVWGIMLDPANFEALSPIGNLLKVFSILPQISAKSFIALLAVMLIEFLGMYAAGHYIFKKRKAEIAEVAITGKAVPFIILAVLALSAFLNVFSGSDPALSIICGMIAAAVVTLIFTFIFYKKPFIKQTAVTLVVVSALSLCFVLCVNSSDFFGYVSYVPEESEVESVELSGANDYSYASLTERIIGVSYFDGLYNDYSDSSVLHLKSEESIKNVLEMHRKIVEKETIKASNRIYDSFSDDYDYDGAYDCKIIYTLKNGKKVVRSYSVNPKSVYEEYVKVMKTEEALSQMVPFRLGDEEILFATVSESDAEIEYYNDYELPSSEALIPADNGYSRLLDCLLADRMNKDNKLFLNNMYDSYGMNYYTDSYNYYDASASVYITFYTWADGTTDEEKAKFSDMTPAQLKKYYDDMYRLRVSGNSDESMPVNEYYIEILSEDENTLEYLSSIHP